MWYSTCDMKLLNGSELAGFIKERQLRAARSLKQSNGVTPTLAIIRTNSEPVVDTYMRLKKSYGEDIGVKVQVVEVAQDEAVEAIKKLNEDRTIHGIIVQLPLADSSGTDEIINTVSSEKDVDGLAAETEFDAPTPTAINWLLAGYNINLPGKKIVVIGQGRLVGAPLTKLLRDSGLDVAAADIHTENLIDLVLSADVIVSATGHPGLITEDMVKDQAIVIDAGVATDNGQLVGDVAASVRERDDITITPLRGGVGPLTLSALFENVLIAARKQAN